MCKVRTHGVAMDATATASAAAMAGVAVLTVGLEDGSRKRLLELVVRKHPAEFAAGGAGPAVAAYEAFMTLKGAVHDAEAKKLSPPYLIDKVWHCHVLDTKSYADFCGRLCEYFGRPPQLLHHDPLGGDDAASVR